jgi:RNA polymerase sigma-70 factor, ECF subfamily
VEIVDEELASASMAGDQRAFEALFTRYYASLVRYVERLTGSRFQSEDVVQEVFVRFLRQRSYRRDRPFRPWLFAVTTNTVRDQLRRGSRVPAPQALEADLSTKSPDPSDVVSGRMATIEVNRLLLQLPLEYRETIALRLGEDMALGQIAETLGVPLGTVKSRLSVGLRQLRQFLRDGPLEHQL